MLLHQWTKIHSFIYLCIIVILIIVQCPGKCIALKIILGVSAQKQSKMRPLLIITSANWNVFGVWGKAGARVWLESQLIFMFVCDIYAVCVIMSSLSLAQFPHCRANCATGVCMEMSLWYNLWQYLHTSYTQTSPSRCLSKMVG